LTSLLAVSIWMLTPKVSPAAEIVEVDVKNKSSATANDLHIVFSGHHPDDVTVTDPDPKGVGGLNPRPPGQKSDNELVFDWDSTTLDKTYATDATIQLLYTGD